MFTPASSLARAVGQSGWIHRTRADHRAALEEVERLMDARPGTPAGDRLDILTTLVEKYEFRHEPIEPPDPIDA